MRNRPGFSFLLVSIGLSLSILVTTESNIFAEALEPASNLSLDWLETAKIVGLAGIISGSLSAFLTHHFSIKKIEKEMQIKKIEETKKFYGRIKSYLDRMLANPDFHIRNEPTDKLQARIDDIDMILMPDYYLASDSVQRKWWKLRESWKLSKLNLNEFGNFKQQVEEMDKILGNELSRL